MKRLLLLAFIPLATFAQSPAEWASGERAKLTQGVTSVPKVGAPGPVAISGITAFPVVVGPVDDGKAKGALMGAAVFGKGRAVAYGHTGYASEAGLAGDPPRAALLTNAIRWTSQKEKPRVGVKDAGLLAAMDKLGFKAKEFRTFTKKDLTDYDVIVVSAFALKSAEDANALNAYIKQGGGVVTAATGWAFEQVTGNQLSFRDQFWANVALRPVGLSFTEDGFDGAGAFTAGESVDPLVNAAECVATLRKLVSGAGTVTEPQLNQMTSSIRLVMSTQPSSGGGFANAVASALSGGEPVVPTEEAPLKEGADALKRLRLAVECQVLSGLPTPEAHAAADFFPGKVAADAPRVTQLLQIDPTVPDWHSTGLYAAPGEVLTVKIPAELVNAGLAVRIGCHSDKLYHKESWPRAPEITRTMKLTSAETQVGSAFGGLVYVVVPGSAKLTSQVPVQIAGAVRSPYFVLGKTGAVDWKMQRQLAAPWGELQCDKVILSVPGDVLKKVDNPDELMRFWTRVVEMEDDLSGVTADRRRPERIVPDVLISAGYMHSGYPIMTHLDVKQAMVTIDMLKTNGWGFWHELGHNHQKGEWTFDGTTEVTCNIFSLYIASELCGKPPGHEAMNPLSVRKKTGDFTRSGKGTLVKWKSDAFLALICYHQIIDAFGWDKMKALFRHYQDPANGPLPTTEQDKMDQWMIRASKVNGKNLSTFFEKWGWPISSQAKAQVSKLEPWLPKGM